MRFAEVAQGLPGEFFKAGKVSRYCSGMRGAFTGFAIPTDGFHSPGVTRPDGGADAHADGGGLQADSGSLVEMAHDCLLCCRENARKDPGKI
jgi:hypothetical protein